MKRLFPILVTLSLLWGVTPLYAAPSPTMAILVQNRGGETLRDRIDPFRDMLTARLTERGFAVVDPRLVRDRFREERGGGPTPVDDPNAFFGETAPSISALNLARGVGADFLLAASILPLTDETKRFSGKGTIYGNDNVSRTVTLRLALTLVDSRGRSIHADQVTVRERVAAVESLEIASSDLVDRLLEQGAARLAEAAGKRIDEIRQAVVPAGESVSFSVSSNPPGVTVELDGNAIGTTPGVFRATPGIHQLRLTRQWLDPWERTVNVAEGQTFSVTLQLSREGMERWQTIERFTTENDRNRVETDLSRKELEADVEMKQKRTEAETDVMRQQSDAEAYRKKALADGEKKRLEESYERIEGAPAPSTTNIIK